MIQNLFAKHGRFCAQRPWEVIIASIAITISVISMSLFTSINKLFGISQLYDPDGSDHRPGMDGVLLVLLKCLALIYIYLQFSKLRKLGSKYLLGIAGLFTVFSSFVFSTVVVDLIGNNLTGLNEALPFFLLLIDLSRASALARFAMSSKSKLEVEENIAHAMAELGPAITLDCIVESLVTGIGSLSGVPQLQTMCFFGCLSILANYCAFMTFYPACLALVLEITHSSSDGEPVWKLKHAIKQCPVEELRPNPVTQKVKLIMSCGLVLVHIHRRLFAEKSVIDTDYTGKDFTLSPHLMSPADSILTEDVTVWELFWKKNWALRLDTLFTLMVAIFLLIKYTLYDIDMDEKPPQSDKSSGSDKAMDETDNLPQTYASLQPSYLEQKSAFFSLGDDDSDIETEDQYTQTEHVMNYFDDVNGEIAKPAFHRPRRSLEECRQILKNSEDTTELTDEEVILLVENKEIPAYKLESVLNNYERGVSIRRQIISDKLKNKSSLLHMPYRHYDYQHVDGACCENVLGYMPLPVGVAGPLLLDGEQYYIPMATTEGCLVASTNRGCRALSAGEGVRSMINKDGMTRAPVARLPSAVEASQVRQWLEDPDNFQVIKSSFDSTSRFAKLDRIQPAQAGRLLYIRFVSTTGDAMGMNMISKGTEKAMNKLQELFPDLETLSLSGNYCTDKKPAAINWIEGRGKSVVAEAVIPGKVVKTVLKTSVSALVDLNLNKNLIGSAMAGSIGGFNAHASNIVTAIFIACGQDAAQNVASSQCITQMEARGEDLHITCTMPCIEVGTVGGGTVLPPQAACLQMLGCQGASQTNPGENARMLARIICATVLAGELSLMSALAAGHLVRSHLRHNRSMSSISPLPVTMPSPFSAQHSRSAASLSPKADGQHNTKPHFGSENVAPTTNQSTEGGLSPGHVVPDPWPVISSRTDSVYPARRGSSQRPSPPSLVSYPVSESGLCQPVVRRADQDNTDGSHQAQHGETEVVGQDNKASRKGEEVVYTTSEPGTCLDKAS